MIRYFARIIDVVSIVFISLAIIISILTHELLVLMSWCCVLGVYVKLIQTQAQPRCPYKGGDAKQRGRHKNYIINP
jgi:hypothetical protein